MTKVAVYNREGSSVGEIELNDAIFNRQVNMPVMHQAVLVYLSSQRRGTHATKTRGLVSGGGKKPWRQKGTGHARAGSTRSPIWKGGGVTFGPQPRSHTIAMPKKMRRAALLSALSLKNQEGKIVVLDELNFDAPKTKEMARILKNLDAANSLVILEEGNSNVLLSIRNMPSVQAFAPDGINTYNILLHDKVLLTRTALSNLEEVLA